MKQMLKPIKTIGLLSVIFIGFIICIGLIIGIPMLLCIVLVHYFPTIHFSYILSKTFIILLIGGTIPGLYFLSKYIVSEFFQSYKIISVKTILIQIIISIIVTSIIVYLIFDEMLIKEILNSYSADYKTERIITLSLVLLAPTLIGVLNANYNIKKKRI